MRKILTRLVCAGLASCFGAFPAANWTSSSHHGPEAALGSPMQVSAAAREPAVEEVLKNIQVLKGVSATEFDLAMRFMAASLGVFCDHCHVTTEHGNWPMEKDDKETKRTARRMILMMRRINEENFGGRTVVTCATCHHGHTSPTSVPPLAELGAATERKNEGKKDAVEKMPTPDETIARYVEALGGKPAIERVTTRVMRGSITGSRGRTFSLEIDQKAPNKFLERISSSNGGESRGYDGQAGWNTGPDGQFNLNGFELEQIRRLADFYFPLKFNDRYSHITAAGMTKIGERDAFVLDAIEMHQARAKFFFDRQTGLLLRQLILTATPLGELPEQIDYEDYRDVDGVKLPFKIRFSELDTILTEMFSQIEQNIALDDSKFAPPVKKP